jgi:hypothetical protein
MIRFDPTVVPAPPWPRPLDGSAFQNMNKLQSSAIFLFLSCCLLTSFLTGCALTRINNQTDVTSAVHPTALSDASEGSPTGEPTGEPQPIPSPTTTRQASPTSEIPLGKAIDVENGWYSYKVPKGFEEQHKYSGAYMYGLWPDQNLMLEVWRMVTIQSSAPTEELLQSYAQSNDYTGTFNLSTAHALKIGNLEGVAIDYSSERPIQGEGMFFAARRNSWDFFLADGFSNEANDPTAWREVGKPYFIAILEAIDFDSVPEPTYQCSTSVNDAYGYTIEHPIQIGGRSIEASLREQAFLDTATGPAGQKVTYTFLGHEDFGTNIYGLDVYEVRYSGLPNPRKIYLSFDGFLDPKLPKGLICNSSFPFSPWPLESFLDLPKVPP